MNPTDFSMKFSLVVMSILLLSVPGCDNLFHDVDNMSYPIDDSSSGSSSDWGPFERCDEPNAPCWGTDETGTPWDGVCDLSDTGAAWCLPVCIFGEEDEEDVAECPRVEGFISKCSGHYEPCFIECHIDNPQCPSRLKCIPVFDLSEGDEEEWDADLWDEFATLGVCLEA